MAAYDVSQDKRGVPWKLLFWLCLPLTLALGAWSGFVLRRLSGEDWQKTAKDLGLQLTTARQQAESVAAEAARLRTEAARAHQDAEGSKAEAAKVQAEAAEARAKQQETAAAEPETPRAEVSRLSADDKRAKETVSELQGLLAYATQRAEQLQGAKERADAAAIALQRSMAAEQTARQQAEAQLEAALREWQSSEQSWQTWARAVAALSRSEAPASGFVPAGVSGAVIESKIDGDFEGWEGETVVKLMNGQIWQQTEYYYQYHYAFMPNVVVYRSGGSWKMMVEGVKKAVGVDRLR